MMHILKQNNIRVKYIFDNDISKAGKDIDYLKISDIQQLKTIDKNIKFIVTSSYYPEIYFQLSELGFKDILHFEYNSIGAVYNYFNFLTDKENINKMFNFLEDEYSRKVIQNILMARITGDCGYTHEVFDKNLENEYFDKDILKLDSNEIFVDGGAYTGDTLLKFLNNVHYKFEKVYLFEPDKNSFKILEQQILNKSIIAIDSGIVKLVRTELYGEKIILNNSGLYDENTKLKFMDEIQMGSHIDESGKNNIDVVKLDDYIKDKKVTFIKMDIEGSEINAIKGCRDLIVNNKPKLAICIYHKPDDLWEIPILIKKLVSDYKIYIRHYGSKLWDTVCYAIPK